MESPGRNLLEAFFEALTPDEIYRLGRWLCLAFASVVALITVARLVARVIVAPFAFRPFVTSLPFRIAAALVFVILVLYFLIPEPGPATGAAPDTGEPVWLGLSKAELLRMIEILILSVPVFLVLFFGVLTVFKAALSVLHIPASVQSPVLSRVIDMLAVIGALAVGFSFLSVQRGHFAETPLDPAMGHPGEAGLFFGLSSTQITLLSETTTYSLLMLVVFVFFVRPLWRALRDGQIGLASWSKKAVAFVGGTTVFLYVVHALWRLFEIVALWGTERSPFDVFIASLTPDEITHLTQKIGWTCVFLFAFLALIHLAIHFFRRYPNAKPPLKVRAYFAAIAAFAGLALYWVFSEFIDTPTPASVLASETGEVIFLEFTKSDLFRITEILIMMMAAIVVSFGIWRLIKDLSSIPVQASFNSPALNRVFGIVSVSGAFIGGIYLLFHQHRMFGEHPLHPAMADPGTGRLLLGLTKVQFLALTETLVLWLVAMLVLRFVIRRLWRFCLKVPVITISPVVQKAVAFIGWATVGLYTARVFWRIIQIATL